MATEKLQFDLDAGKSNPKAAPEKKPAGSPEKSVDAVPAIGDTMSKEFKTDSDKKILGDEFQKTLTEKFTQFSKDFQAKFCDAQGQPDVQKILGLFGLDKLLGAYIPKPGAAPEVPAGNGSSGSPEIATADNKSGQPAAKKGGSNLLSFSSGNADIPTGNSKIPENPGTMTGTEFLRLINQMGNRRNPENERKIENLIMEQVAKGNIPSFCRPENGKTIGMKGADGTVVKFKASNDYLAVGNERDFVRVPMTPILAQMLSKNYNWGMPTGLMTDAIHDTADIKLNGVGLVHNKQEESQMLSIDFIDRHNSKINEMLGPDGLARLQSGKYLVAGHKKDLIISSVVVGNPNGPLDFRGLYTDGVNPIQHNPAHEWNYPGDYSNCFRPIYGNVIIAHADGSTETKPYYEALQDPNIAKIINGAQGAFDAKMAYVDPRNQPSPDQGPAKDNLAVA